MSEDSLGHIGKYDLRAEIGRGGFGVVYRAVDTSLGREVALKVLHPQLTVDPEFIARFRQEAQAASRLEHPHIITIYEFGQADGRFFIAMRYVSGQSLKQLIAADGPLPLERAAGILRQAAEALDYAHQRGLVHRDVKSANIMVGADDGVWLADFGLVRAAEGGSVMTSLKSGAMIGTPEYMAPEQLDTDFSGTVDARADVYALGIVAYEMFTGRVPYLGNTPAVVTAHLIKPVPDARDYRPATPAAVAEVIKKALAKDREARWGTAGEFARAIAAASRPLVPAAPELEAPSAGAAKGQGVNPANARVGPVIPAVADRAAELETPGASTAEEQVVTQASASAGPEGPAQPRVWWWGAGALALLLVVSALFVLWRVNTAEAGQAAATQTAAALANGSAGTLAAAATDSARPDPTLISGQTPTRYESPTATGTLTPTTTVTETPTATDTAERTATRTRTPRATGTRLFVTQTPAVTVIPTHTATPVCGHGQYFDLLMNTCRETNSGGGGGGGYPGPSPAVSDTPGGSGVTDTPAPGVSDTPAPGASDTPVPAATDTPGASGT